MTDSGFIKTEMSYRKERERRMNGKQKHRAQKRTYAAMAVIGCLACFQAGKAEAFLLPADTGKGVVTSLMGEETAQGVIGEPTANKGSAGRTDGSLQMENLKMYPGTLTEEEKEILYKVVSMECDTGYEGSLAVISCMMNRTQSEKYSEDLMEVVTEDSQFTAYYDKETGTYPYVDRQPSRECIAAVNDALYKGKRNIPSYILYFRSSDYDSLYGYETYGQIGDNTYFYQVEDKMKLQ